MLTGRWLLGLGRRLRRNRQIGDPFLKGAANPKRPAKAGTIMLGECMTFPDHPHSLLHRHAGMHTRAAVSHWSYHRGHLVHHVMRQMAVEHPVTKKFSLEFKVSGLRDPDDNRILGSPRCLRYTAPFCRSEEHTSELQSQSNLVCRLLLEKK